MAIVSAVVVTGTVGVVLVFCTGGAPSASDSGNLTRVRSATDCDCVVVPDAVSRFGAAGAAVATVSASSGGLTCNLGIGPIKIGSRSLRTFKRSSSRDWCRFPRIPNHGVQESRIPASSLHGCEPCHSVYRSNAHLFCCHVRAKCLRAMRIPVC